MASKTDITIVITKDGKITIEGMEASGAGSKDVHNTIDKLSRELATNAKETKHTMPALETDPIELRVGRT
tara:strand:- start:333 stop:542 length:210 start_codon:yes stop_codon:yes gene_type:complete